MNEARLYPFNNQAHTKNRNFNTVPISIIQENYYNHAVKDGGCFTHILLTRFAFNISTFYGISIPQ